MKRLLVIPLFFLFACDTVDPCLDPAPGRILAECRTESASKTSASICKTGQIIVNHEAIGPEPPGRGVYRAYYRADVTIDAWHKTRARAVTMAEAVCLKMRGD